MKLIRPTSSSEHGQSMVELMISFIVLVLLIAGITDLGRAFFAYSSIRDAAQEGATYGSLYPSDTNGIIERVRDNSDTPVDLKGTQIKINVNVIGVPCMGSGINVTVKYEGFQFINPVMRIITGTDTIDLTAHVTDEIVRPPCK